MKSITNFLIESVSTDNWILPKTGFETSARIPKDASTFINWLSEKHGKKLDGYILKFMACVNPGKLNKTSFLDFVNFCFNKAIENGASESKYERNYPFVCGHNTKKGFVIRRSLFKEIEHEYPGLDMYNPEGPNSVKVSGFCQGFHSTSMADNGEKMHAAADGLEHEMEDMFNLLFMLIRLGEEYAFRTDNNQSTDKLSKEEFDNLFSDKYINRLYELYAVEDLSEAIQGCYDIYCEKGEGEDLNDFLMRQSKSKYNTFKKYIYFDGTGKTQRNKEHQILDTQNIEDLGYTNGTPDAKSKIEKFMRDSGDIIADIVIKSGGKRINISCKLDKAQLSGISLHSVMNKNDSFKKFVYSDTMPDYDSKVRPECTEFHNIWTLFGSDPKMMFEAFWHRCGGQKEVKNDKGQIVREKSNLKDLDRKFAAKGDGTDKLGDLFRRLVGGNYWYLKETSDIFFVKCEPCELMFEPKHVDLVDSAKSFRIKGTLKGTSEIDAEIQIRTDGSGDLPYRMFPIVNVHDMMGILK